MSKSSIYLCKNKDVIEVGQDYEDFYGDKVKVLYICDENNMNLDETGRREPFFVLRKKQDGTIKYHFIPVQAFVSSWDKRNDENNNKRLSSFLDKGGREKKFHKSVHLDTRGFSSVIINLN